MKNFLALFRIKNKFPLEMRGNGGGREGVREGGKGLREGGGRGVGIRLGQEVR